MTSDKRVMSSLSTTSVDYADSYYEHYDAKELGPYSWESLHWRTFFGAVADRIVGLLEPKLTMDVGCAKGLLVQALAERGVDSYGRDISESAVESAHPDVRHRLSVASATEPIEGRYDLITCVEVLEHLSAEDAQIAIDVMCSATDRILFSSTPGDFDEATHVNVHPTAQWAAWFAERGFYRRTDSDVTFLATWAVLFERAELSKRSIVERYETQLAPMNTEIVEKRRALLETERQLSEAQAQRDSGGVDDAAILARHADLVAVDNVIGLEATVARLQDDLRNSRRRVQRLRDKVEDLSDELAATRSSRTWKVGRMITRPLGRLRG
jgi:2-polyprenyl-3-methyl-5-hydroxy-6-metoxy-1,4-benzoquinol methylase